MVYFFDYNLGPNQPKGLEILKSLPRESLRYLVTGHFDDPALQKICDKELIFIIPKPDVGSIPWFFFKVIDSQKLILTCYWLALILGASFGVKPEAVLLQNCDFNDEYTRAFIIALTILQSITLDLSDKQLEAKSKLPGDFSV